MFPPTISPTPMPTSTPGRSGIAYEPTELDYPPAIAGLGHYGETVTLQNLSQNSATLASITAAPSRDFTMTNNCPMSPETLASGASCAITVTFQPTDSGILIGKLRVKTSNPKSTQVITLSGYSAPQPILGGLKVKTALNFEGVKLGSTKIRRLTIRNAGRQKPPVQIDSIATDGDFSTTSDCPDLLPSGAKCHVNVDFQPTASGERGSTLIVSYDSGANTILQSTVTLSGSGK
jgi:hypothetical protein